MLTKDQEQTTKELAESYRRWGLGEAEAQTVAEESEGVPYEFGADGLLKLREPAEPAPAKDDELSRMFESDTQREIRELLETCRKLRGEMDTLLLDLREQNAGARRSASPTPRGEDDLKSLAASYQRWGLSEPAAQAAAAEKVR